MHHEGRGKAAKVDENVSQWTKICRSTVRRRRPSVTQATFLLHARTQNTGGQL